MGNQKPRRLTSTVLGLLIVFSVLSVMNFTSMNVLAYDETIPWNNGYTVNATAQKWFPTPGNSSCLIIMQNGNLTIESGYTLTFNDSVTFQVINPAPPTRYGIIIEPNGEFRINSSLGDTEIVSDPGNKERTYHFTNSGTLDFLGATVERVYGDPSNKDTTGGIRNNPGSVCKLDNCDILDADTHSLFVNGTSANSVELNIANTELTNTTSNVLNGTGIWIKGNSNVEINNVTVENTQEYGIKCVDVGFDVKYFVIRNGTVKNSATHGIYIQNSTAIVRNNHIYDNEGSGIYINLSSPPANNVFCVENETVYGPAVGGEMGPLWLDNGNIINCSLYLDDAGDWWLMEEGAYYTLNYATGEIDISPVTPLDPGLMFYAYYNYSVVTVPNDAYDWVSLFAHSAWYYHGLVYNSGSTWRYVFNTEVSTIDPIAHFYNLFCCSAGLYTQSSNAGCLAGHYVFSKSHSLSVIASTKTGSML
ncbi:MAG: right-handed parallel beta-helix repeat-containing protein, partial [Thermoplasmata archaeon]|nr:right-handed parallel beta-helix repeat-containing protein [Thermoplasmata archaeon]